MVGRGILLALSSFALTVLEMHGGRLSWRVARPAGVSGKKAIVLSHLELGMFVVAV